MSDIFSLVHAEYTESAGYEANAAQHEEEYPNAKTHLSVGNSLNDLIAVLAQSVNAVMWKALWESAVFV